MSETRKHGIIQLLKGIETADPESVKVIHPQQYIQHNPQTNTGREGLLELFQRLSQTHPRVNIVRIFSDGDFVFGHTEYDFSTRRIGFEIFRFEGNLAVEHWDNIQPRQGPNPSGHSMVDGLSEATELEHTERNRKSIKEFIRRVLIQQEWHAFHDFVSVNLIQHHPELADGLESWLHFLTQTTQTYIQMHRVLAEGNFVLAACEGRINEQAYSFYHLFRLSQDKIVEHWNTTEKIPDPIEWKNKHGKF